MATMLSEFEIGFRPDLKRVESSLDRRTLYHFTAGIYYARSAANLFLFLLDIIARKWNKRKMESKSLFFLLICVPFSTAKGCAPLPPPPSGRLVASVGGAVQRIECNPGYYPSGSAMLFCDKYEWNGTTPTCQGKKKKKIRLFFFFFSSVSCNVSPFIL